MSPILAERPAILEKASQIADMITKTQEMQMFRQAERALRTDGEAQELMQAMQQQGENGEGVEQLLDRLENLDVVRHFTLAQDGLSDVISHVTRIVAATVSERLDMVLATDDGGCCSGCTSCGSASACEGTGGCDSGVSA
ncbi:MAG TPA: YlbF family regulator [Bacilli bacterium]|nr:YlbF family regulator [Bacilli bacterium]